MAFGFEVIIIGLILSSDSFSAALAMGARPFSRKDAIKFGVCSGSAEAISTLVGALAGSKIISKFAVIDHWIAFALLMAVALHMGYEAYQDLVNKEEKEEPKKFHGFIKILIVSFATSLDALGVGVGIGVSNKPILPYIISIGLWAFATTIIGLYVAKKFSKKSAPIFTLIGAIILGIIAFEMLKI